MSPPARRRERAGKARVDTVARATPGSGPNYSSSNAPHHHWQKHSSIAALSKHINSVELKVIDFLRVFFFFSLCPRPPTNPWLKEGKRGAVMLHRYL